MRFELFFRVLFFIALALVLFLTLNPSPPTLPVDRFGDKFEHALAFSALAGLAGLGFSRASELRILERLSFVGAMIEVVQAIPEMHRSCEWRDWVADTLGIAFGLGILRLVLRFLPQLKARPTYEHSTRH